MKVKVIDQLTDKDLNDLLIRNLKKLKAYKEKGHTALRLISNRTFSKMFVEKYFDQV